VKEVTVEPVEIPSIDLTEDPRDRITVKENEFLQELKKNEIASQFSDVLLMVFAFARKLDIKRTVEMLQLNHKWMTDHKYSWNERIPESKVNPKLLETKYTFNVPNCKDNIGRGIVYLFPSRIIFKHFTLTEHLDYLIHLSFSLMLDNKLDIHRAGFVYVEELKGVKLSNFDMKISKSLNADIQNNFPNRVKAIYIMHGGFILKALLKIAKFFVKAKIIARVSTVEMPELLKLIDKSQLITEFGGELTSGIDWKKPPSKK